MAQAFGGRWTEIKLDMLAAYLHAYAKVMKNQPYRRWYVDAFAGTGFRSISDSGGLLEKEATTAAGSARLALDVEPPFDRYVLIERNRRRYDQLRLLAETRPDLAGRMDFRCGDANEELIALAASLDRRRDRAVVLLDPFGMQVDWRTLEALAGTQIVDLWYLVPTGIALNRVLPREQRPFGLWQKRINRMLGDRQWESFYRMERVTDLFGAETEEAWRDASLGQIEAGVIERLKTLFPGVAKRGAIMRARRSALYLLVLCCANPSEKANKAALRIAEHILGKAGRSWPRTRL